MREHMGLFRGKRLDNREWVEGNLLFDHVLGITEIAGFEYWTSETGIERGGFCELVDPDTVGECTSMCDKDGKLIFEGDLFRFYDECIGVVIFKDGCFRLQVYGLCGAYTESGYDVCGGGWDIVECEPIDWYYIHNLNIIGNAHDNPELMEGAGD